MGVSNLALSAALFFGFLLSISAHTDPFDVAALQTMYRAMNDPPQLGGWKAEGGDPCGMEWWHGVVCSGDRVTIIKIRGLGIGGYLALQESGFQSLKELDASNNIIGGEIPNPLPKNATLINLSCNQFTASVPASLPSLKFLGHLNLSHNLLSGPLGDVFTDLKNLKELDLSFNDFSGDLPSSFGSLTHLHGLYMQQNQFTGSVQFLSHLPLSILNIENNNFSGIIPKEFANISRLKIGGNMFQPGYALPLDHGNDNARSLHLPPHTVDTTVIPSTLGQSFEPFDNSNKRNLVKGATAGTSLLLLAIFAIIFLIMLKRRRRHRRPKRFKHINHTSHALPISFSKEDQDNSLGSACLSARISPPVLHTISEKVSGRISNPRRSGSPSFATMHYSALNLSIATNSFGEENLLGGGSTSHVYKAEFPDGQIFAVKKIDLAATTINQEDEFLDLVACISRLKHPNILEIRGYCVEEGQHILIYDYFSNGSLDEVLHISHDCQETLAWKARTEIALGIARALEYMHLTCSPPVAHGNLHPRNILLDDMFVPHVGDFGLNALAPLVSTRMKPSELTIYNAPEHGHPETDMTRCDIFSFGVVLLELLTGQRAFDRSRPLAEQSLVEMVSYRFHDLSLFEELVDPTIKDSLPPRALSQFVDIISVCLQPQPELRQTITEIAGMLVSLIQKDLNCGRRS